MKQRVEYGEIVKFNGGSVQYAIVGKEILIVSSRLGEIRIPIDYIHKALEDEWKFERTSRGT